MKIRYSVIITLLVGLLALACASEEKQEGDAPEIISAPSTATENTLLSFLTDKGCDIERHCRVFLGGRELPSQVYKQVTQPAIYVQPTAEHLGKNFEIAVTVPTGSVAQCDPQNITGTGGCLEGLYVQDIAKRKSTEHFVTIFDKGPAPPPPDQQCVTNANCQEGYTCINGKCYTIPTPPKQVCYQDNDCALNEICQQGDCVPETVPSECNIGGDCASGEKCKEIKGIKQCVAVAVGTACEGMLDCGKNQICDNGICQEKISCQLSAECPDNKECFWGTCYSQEFIADFLDSWCSTFNKPDGTACSEGKVCQGGQCVDQEQPPETSTPREIIEELVSVNVPYPPYGGTGGSAFEEKCQNGYVVTGIEVFFTSSDKTNPTGLRLACTAPLGDKHQGINTEMIGAVGSTATSFKQLLECPNALYTDTSKPQGVVTGLHFIFGEFFTIEVLQGLQLICGRLTQNADGDLFVTYDDFAYLTDCVGQDCTNNQLTLWIITEILAKINSSESVKASLSTTTGYEHYARVQVPKALLTGYHGRKGALIDALGITYKTMP